MRRDESNALAAMQADITIREILQTGLLSCRQDTAVADAAAQMVKARCSSIMVEDAAGTVVGIWTERDALALDLTEPGLLQAPIEKYMSSPVKTLSVTTGIGEAALRFREERIRHFLVLDEAGKPCGVISQSDIVINQGIEYFIALREVDAVFNRRYQVVVGTLPMSEAVAQMRSGQLDAIIVQRSDGVYGILTERDVVRLISDRQLDVVVEAVASYPLITLPLKTSLYQARKVFVDNRIRHLGVTGAGGELLGLVTFSDILANIEHEYVHHLREALREAEANLAASHQTLRLAAKAFESTFEGILVTNADRVIESVNPAFTQITGYQAQEVIGKTPAMLASGRHDAAFYNEMYQALQETGHWQGEICNRRKNGEAYVEWLTINAVKDPAGKVTNYVAVFTDFTTRKQAEDEIRFLAEHDPLTRLPNRTLLRERLSRAMAHADRNGKKVAVIFLDLDDFKGVNDNFGHGAGDEMLRVVAERMVEAVRREDTVARLAGDEFVLVLEDLSGVEGIAAIVNKIVDAVARPVVHEGREIKVATSVGVSLYPDHGNDVDILVKHADEAMYAAKEKGSVFELFGER